MTFENETIKPTNNLPIKEAIQAASILLPHRIGNLSALSETEFEEQLQALTRSILLVYSFTDMDLDMKSEREAMGRYFLERFSTNPAQ